MASSKVILSATPSSRGRSESPPPPPPGIVLIRHALDTEPSSPPTQWSLDRTTYPAHNAWEKLGILLTLPWSSRLRKPMAQHHTTILINAAVTCRQALDQMDCARRGAAQRGPAQRIAARTCQWQTSTASPSRQSGQSGVDHWSRISGLLFGYEWPCSPLQWRLNGYPHALLPAAAVLTKLPPNPRRAQDPPTGHSHARRGCVRHHFHCITERKSADPG